MQGLPVLEPLPDLEKSRNVAAAGPTLQCAVALKLRPPAPDLPAEEVFGPTQILQADLHMIQPAERRNTLDQRQPHSPANGRIRRMQRRHPDGRVEAIDWLHQIKGGTENIL
jgi:hypothetical protein